MPEAPIPFGNTQESGNAELSGASPVAINVLVDGKGTVRRRPGLAAYSAVPSDAVDSDGIAGLHVTAADTLLIAGESRKLWRVLAGAAIDLSPSPSEELAGYARPVFAENQVAVIVAGGDEIQVVDLTTFTSARLNLTSTDAPPKATHVAANSSRFLANDLTSAATSGEARYSKTGVTDYAEWPGRYFFSGEARPDPVRAVGENIDEVWLWGSTTTQVFVPDASSVYAPAKTLPYGIAAPYSMIDVDGSFAWLDPAHRFMFSDGRTSKELSGPIAKTLDGITTFSDCFGYRVNTDQFDCLVWTFPSDGRSFCYQLDGGWSQWQGRQGSNWTVFPVTAHRFREADNIDVVGLADGRVCQLTTTANTDLGDMINAEVTTGFLNRGTNAIKKCVAVLLVLQRGETEGTDEPVALLSYRDSGGPWEDPIPVSLGVSGDRETTVELRSLGSYRQRDWRLTFSGSEEWVLASATETFEVAA